MADYVNSSNTLSFIKFDKNPSSNVITDSILNSPITWVKNNIQASNLVYKSRKYSMQSYSTPTGEYRNPFTINNLYLEIPLDNNLGLFDYRDGNVISGNITLDFWFYPRKKQNELYKSRPLMVFYGLENSTLHQVSSVAITGQDTIWASYNFISSIILSAYETNSSDTIGVYIQTESNKRKTSSAVSSSSYPSTTHYFIKLGEVQTNKWSHFAFMRSGIRYSFAVNGKISTHGQSQYSSLDKNKTFCFPASFETTYSSTRVGGAKIALGSYIPFENSILTGAVGSLGDSIAINDTSYIITQTGTSMPTGNIDLGGKETEPSSIFFDNVRISRDILWSNDFIPPGDIGRQIFVYDGYAYYTNEYNNVVKLSFAKWDDISISDKLILLDMVSYNSLPDVDQIKLIQTDPSKDIVCYNYQTDTVKPTIKIEKIDSSASAIVYPTKFLDYGAIQDYIKNIKATGSTNATSNIRLAITRDGETYYTYNATNVAWVPLDNRSDVRTSGILLDSLDDIPASSWKQFGLDKFAFSISLIKMNENDPCQINDITLSISLDEKWVKANKSTQVKYKYVGPTLLKVNLLEEGKYKINYNDRG